MERLVLGKVLAITGLVGVGVAAPGAVWLAQNGSELDLGQATQAAPFGGGISPGLQLPTPKLALDLVALVQLDRMVIAVPTAQPQAGGVTVDRSRRGGERSCRRQASETFDRGQVRVCDVERTAVERGVGVFGGIDKGTKLVPRDLPSPSGLGDGL
ncbi:MAG: hypothetical protein JRI68_28550 [Deltaproteobacteria bacterium]|nr:hypothetical protein [Deltaproteobacteria bacterium]